MLKFDWPTIVGPELAVRAVPKRLTSGTLTIACAAPVALELAHLAPQILARVNTYLGGGSVSRLRFSQDPLPGHPEIQRTSRPSIVVAPAKSQVAGEDRLDAALASLGRAVVPD